MSITLLAAISKNNCIGKGGELPWNIPKDMKRVRQLTTGKIVIMGRKTWESIPEKFRPLPNRTNVVITSDARSPLPEGVERYATIDAAIAAHKEEEIIGFGGERIFQAMLPLADCLEITRVDTVIEGCDAFFPKIDPALWQEVWREDHDGYAFFRYTRRS